MKNDRVIRYYPFTAWLGAILFLGAGIYFNIAFKMNLATTLIVCAVGLILFVFGQFETITVDQNGKTIHIHRRTVIKKTDITIQQDEIATIELDTLTHRDSSRRRSTEYRPVIKKKDGTDIPVRSIYSGNLVSVNNLCSQLRVWLNLNDPEKPQGLVQNLMGSKLELMREGMEQQQEAITGESDDIHETAGIHWQLKTRNTGSSPVSQWTSTDFTDPDHFVYLAQKVHGSANLGGFLSGLTKTLYIQSMAIYGFTDFHAPDMQNGTVYDNINERIDADFGGFGDSVAGLRKIVNSYVIQALSDWAIRHPLKQNGVQMAVLIGPKGVYLATLGLVSQDHLQEMTNLGVELVKSLKSGV
jgi:hypothetical protein